MCRLLRIYKISFLSVCVLLSSCQMFWAPHSPKGYVLPRPELHFVDKKLNEVSGLYYLRGEGAMLAVADDKRHIYRVTTDGASTDYIDSDFGPAADYEDVAKVGDRIFVLVSNGALVEVFRDTSGALARQEHYFHAGDTLAQKKPHAIEGKKKIAIDDTNPNVDFETLYYDSTARGLILIAKHIKGESQQGIRSAWRFDLATRRFDPKPFFTISIKAVNNALKDGQIEFKPSAAAINPLDNRLYVLSSAGHLLVVTDLRGKVAEAYRLNPTFYPQAEGIAFAENGDMYISNEAKLGKASLLRIPYGRGRGQR